MSDKTFYEKFICVQSELKVPKSHFNNFAKFNYRNCEDILEALKPLLAKYSLFVRIYDKIEMIGDRFYLKATVVISDGDKEISSFAYAREEKQRAGMDASQMTGATSSYARKYALNALLAIDDGRDADSCDNSDITKEQGKQEKQANQSQVNDRAVSYFSENAVKVSNIEQLDEIFDYVISPLKERGDHVTTKVVEDKYNAFKKSLESANA